MRLKKGERPLLAGARFIFDTKIILASITLDMFCLLYTSRCV